MYSPIIKQYMKKSTYELKQMEKTLSSPISMGLMNTPYDFECLSAVRQVLRSRQRYVQRLRA